jgi:hypothetical protein
MAPCLSINNKADQHKILVAYKTFELLATTKENIPAAFIDRYKSFEMVK